MSYMIRKGDRIRLKYKPKSEAYRVAAEDQPFPSPDALISFRREGEDEDAAPGICIRSEVWRCRDREGWQ